MGNKRKRTSSGGSTITSAVVTENLHRYGELILHCTVNITHGIRECGNSMVLKNVCALLNSGGGILHMRNMDLQRGPVLSKHLDTWWSGMECKMADIISKDDICNYFDLVGNHDDPDLYLFVKTAEHLCTLDYNCRLPTDTATHDVTYQSVMKLVTSQGEPGTLEDLPLVPGVFIYGRAAERTKKETKQIQFKQLSSPQQRSGKGLPDKIKSLMLKYVSAFANHEGGHIFFGIDDVRASVIGEELTEVEQKETERLVTNRMKSVIWGDESTQVVRGTHWDIQFYPVENHPRKYHRVVVVVSVCKFPGCVFTSCPESYYVNREGTVVDFSFSLWRDSILNPLRDVPELHSRFIKLPMNVPNSPLVFTLPNTIQDIKNKTLIGQRDLIAPRHFTESYAGQTYKDEIMSTVQTFKGDNSVCIGLECWGLKIPFSCPDVLCDIVVADDADGVHVLTFSVRNLPHVREHSQTVATVLKNKIVTHGGFRHKFGVVCHVIDVTNVQKAIEWEQNILNRDLYPSHFNIHSKFNAILDSLVVCMASYRARAQISGIYNPQGSYNFLLTRDQFELLWTQQFTKDLWVHGPPGAGKTVAAIQLMQELRRRGCNHENILYLAENAKLCDFVMEHNLCMVSTRRNLLAEANDSVLMQRKYGQICNVIVDEAQNFKDWDGDWYSLAEQLANQVAPQYLHRCSNYFWVFMDYSQKVHKFKAGLPSVIGKNNFMLSEISRNTKEIFEFTSRLMMASENVEGLCNPYLRQSSVPKLAHSYSAGKGVDIMSCQESEIQKLVNKVLSEMLKNGVKENDIAILVGTKSELDKLKPSLEDLPSLAKHDKEEVIKGRDGSLSSEDKDIEITASCKPVKPLLRTEHVVDTINKDEQAKVIDKDEENDNISMSDSGSLETSNPFDVLAVSTSQSELGSTEDMAMDENVIEEREQSVDSSDNKVVTFYGCESDDDLNESDQNSRQSSSYVSDPAVIQEKGHDSIAVDTVRGFSGLDKAAVIGINPEVNKDHADFNRFMLSLASRARDNLVIITTSDNVKEQLNKLILQH